MTRIKTVGVFRTFGTGKTHEIRVPLVVTSDGLGECVVPVGWHPAARTGFRKWLRTRRRERLSQDIAAAVVLSVTERPSSPRNQMDPNPGIVWTAKPHRWRPPSDVTAASSPIPTRELLVNSVAAVSASNVLMSKALIRSLLGVRVTHGLDVRAVVAHLETHSVFRAARALFPKSRLRLVRHGTAGSSWDLPDDTKLAEFMSAHDTGVVLTMPMKEFRQLSSALLFMVTIEG